MKKIIGVVLVLFFVFSLSSIAHAGPAQEKLKGKTFYVGYQFKATPKFLKKLEEIMLEMKFSKEYVSELIERTKRKGTFAAAKLVNNPGYIFSNESFRKTIRARSARYMKKIFEIFWSVQTWSNDQ